MAKIAYNVTFNWETLMDFPERDQRKVINAAAAVIKPALYASFNRHFSSKTGQLARSIAIYQRQRKNGDPVARIGPDWEHPRANAYTGVRYRNVIKRKKRTGARYASGNYTGTNAEIAGILEWGDGRIPKSAWALSANAASRAEAMAAAKAAYNQVLKKHMRKEIV